MRSIGKVIGIRRGSVSRMVAVICVTALLMMPLLVPERANASDSSVPVTDIPDNYVLNQATQGSARNGLYNRFFLKDSLQEIRITLPEENLEYLLDNAVDKVSVMTKSVKIGNETVCYTGLKTKGDYTLIHGVNDNNSNRYSFTINFGKYIRKAEYGDKQNFFGLRKLSLNNFFFDKSMLKEFASYYLISEMKLPASQYGLAKVYINDEYYGVYFMVEAFDYSVLEQYYRIKKSMLGKYFAKPVGTDLEYDDISRTPELLWDYDEELYEDVKDDIPLVTESLRKLNNLSSGLDFDGNEIDVNSSSYIELLSKVMNVDEVLRYFAVHSFLVQTDNMFTVQHNFGLYCDPDGRLVIVPWDYDLSFGTYYPLNSEATANYDIDIMYNIYESWQSYNNHDHSAAVYASFPLFNVIFRNDELMERYHTYMLDCSKIMSLGGYTSDNRFYEPANMYKIIEDISEELIEAASEKTSSKAVYMNGIRQPRDVKNGIPNLEKIIALRSVGVYSQLSDDRSWVSGSGCDLLAVGNGLSAKPKSSGYLSSVDAATGIFVTADYLNAVPGLSVRVIDSESEEYASFAAQFPNGEKLTVYDISQKNEASSDYRLTIPMGRDFCKNPGDFRFYQVIDGELTEISADREDNLALITVSSLGTFVISETGSIIDKINIPENMEISFKDTLFVAGIAIVVVMMASGGYAIAKAVKRRSGKGDKT